MKLIWVLPLVSPTHVASDRRGVKFHMIVLSESNCLGSRWGRQSKERLP